MLLRKIVNDQIESVLHSYSIKVCYVTDNKCFKNDNEFLWLWRIIFQIIFKNDSVKYLRIKKVLDIWSYFKYFIREVRDSMNIYNINTV